VQCPSHCYNCTNNGTCLNCFTGFANQASRCTAMTSLICSSGMYQYNGICLTCSPSCLSCSNYTGCNCSSSSYLQNQTCFPCDSSHSVCNVLLPPNAPTSASLIVGIVMGIVGLILIVITLFCIYRRCMKGKGTSSDTIDPSLTESFSNNSHL
jgi:hypothetical protein